MCLLLWYMRKLRRRAYTPTPIARPYYTTRPWHVAGCDHDVFVCYVSTDKPVAERLVEALEGGHLKCWYAPRDLTPGSEWGKEILKAIDSTCLVVAVVSDKAVSNDWFIREIQHAALGDKTIVPFMLTDGELGDELKYSLQRYQYVDATRKPLDESIEYLCRKLGLERYYFDH